jgi:hypothetical protein
MERLVGVDAGGGAVQVDREHGARYHSTVFRRDYFILRCASQNAFPDFAFTLALKCVSRRPKWCRMCPLLLRFGEVSPGASAAADRFD